MIDLMTDKKELEKIYEANLKIETFHELKVNPPIAGHIAKKLINNSKRALAIVEKYHTALIEKDLREGIQDMEDDLASKGRIGIITYNLGARIAIHVAVEWVDRWTKKDEDESSTN